MLSSKKVAGVAKPAALLASGLAGAAFLGALLWNSDTDLAAKVETDYVVTSGEQVLSNGVKYNEIKFDSTTGNERVIYTYYMTASGTSMNFRDARDYCNNFGFDLARPDEEFVTAMKAAELTTGRGYHAGLVRSDSAGWYYLSGGTGSAPGDYHSAGHEQNEGYCSIFVTTDAYGMAKERCDRNTAGIACEDFAYRNVIKTLYRDSVVAVKAFGYGYTAAEAMCEKLGTELLTVSTAEENTLAQEAMQSLGIDAAWIGLTAESGSFAWQSGASVTYKNFRSGADTVATDRRAVIDNTFGHADWLSVQTRNADYVPSGFLCDGYHFKVVVPPTNLKWGDANDYCAATEKQGLVTIHSAAENDAIYNAVKGAGQTRAWIGLHDQDSEGEFGWIDMSPVDYTNWYKGQPNNYGSSGQDCGEIYSPGLGTWTDMRCAYESAAFVCSTLEPFNSIDLCLDNGGDSCDPASVVCFVEAWQSAEDYCQSKYSSNLVAVKSDDANGQLKTAIAALAGSTATAHIGLKKTAESEWAWTNSADADYRNWAANEPSNSDAARMNVEDGLWYPITASTTADCFVCDKKSS